MVLRTTSLLGFQLLLDGWILGTLYLGQTLLVLGISFFGEDSEACRRPIQSESIPSNFQYGFTFNSHVILSLKEGARKKGLMVMLEEESESKSRCGCFG